ncbi:cobalt ECF transporter T component CbiQ [Spirochaetia bacterium]|nr:cobalt ECF transporter T component CbiQ [Spirochaetia bacterium]
MSLYHRAAGIDHLERLAQGRSPIHRLHPGAKIITTIVYAAAVISFDRPVNLSGLTAFLLYPAILMALSGTPAKPLFTRLLAALPFSLMGGLSNLILLRAPVFFIGSIAVTAGMLSFVSIMLKTLLTVLAVLILIATTTFADINWQLTRMGMPKILGLQFVMTWRYITALLGEAASMYTSYMVRTPGQKGIRMKDMGAFLGQLLLRSFDRAERVYQAMKCRGFDGVYRGAAEQRFHPSDLVYTLGVSSLTVLLRFFNLSHFFGALVNRVLAELLK